MVYYISYSNYYFNTIYNEENTYKEIEKMKKNKEKVIVGEHELQHASIYTFCYRGIALRIVRSYILPWCYYVTLNLDNISNKDLCEKIWLDAYWINDCSYKKWIYKECDILNKLTDPSAVFSYYNKYTNVDDVRFIDLGYIVPEYSSYKLKDIVDCCVTTVDTIHDTIDYIQMKGRENE